MKQIKNLSLIIFLVIPFNIFSLKLDRVILACDNNPTYTDFWPAVSRAWTKIIGVKPTLAFIAPKGTPINTTLGDVIYFEPIPDIPNWFYAQVIRLFLPMLFENEVCITSDMDMMPLNRAYFQNNIANIADDKFVVYRDKAGDDGGRYPMCYVAAKGKVFKEIFGLNNISDIPKLTIEWFNRGMGWDTDEVLLREYVYNWHTKTGRLVKLGHNIEKRIDRGNWRYNSELLKGGKHYNEAHMIRPYSWHKKELDAFFELVGVKN